MKRRCTSPYRGCIGLREVYYVALLDRNHQVLERLSPTFTNLQEATKAWLARRDRRARLVRELLFIEVAI